MNNKHIIGTHISKEFMDSANNTLENLATNNRLRLDYSHESLQEIEKLLSLMHNDFKETGNAEGLHGIALACAAYIVQTIQKNTGEGTWYKDDSQFGEDVFPLEWKKRNILYPLAWCEKRIFDGEGDNVWSKYQTLVLKEEAYD